MTTLKTSRLPYAMTLALVALAVFAAPSLAANGDIPKSAKKLALSLVPAYADCLVPNTVHNTIQLNVSGIYQLAPGCVPAIPSSALHFGPAGKGSVTLSLKGPAASPDVKIVAKITDVRDGSDAPFTGPLSGVATVRVSDWFCNNIDGQQCTPIDTNLIVPATCTAGSCQMNTTLNSELPGTIYPGKQANGEIVDFVILDDLNLPFLRPGLFVP